MAPRKWSITVLAGVLLLALTAMGVGYGLWYETLHVEGQIETGYLDAAWTSVWCYENEQVKQVAGVSGYPDLSDPKLVHFEISNGYPLYMGGCEIEYRYTGSVPVHVEDARIIPGPGLSNCVCVKQANTGTVTCDCDEMEIRFIDGLCTQLHAGDELASSLRVTIQQPALENHHYDFDLEIQLNQYNESECP